jgi:hypothetical protein
MAVTTLEACPVRAAQKSANGTVALRRLVLKGGTALRSIYLPDFRYSADLDFTVLGGSAQAAAVALGKLLEAARDHVGLPHLDACFVMANLRPAVVAARQAPSAVTNDRKCLCLGPSLGYVHHRRVYPLEADL